MGCGQIAPASGHAESDTLETATGKAERPGGGLLEKVEKALVGTLLCLVAVNGEACMCSKRLGAGAEHGEGERA